MHTVIGEQCTGCELCIPACPVDCIAMIDASSPRTGWAAWSAAQAAQARERYAWHGERLRRDQIENDERLAAKAQAKLKDLETASAITDPQLLESKRAIVEAALARARRQRESR
jgi:electron transport complex protein RnfB